MRENDPNSFAFFYTFRESATASGTSTQFQHFIKEFFMYFACTALVFALTIFVPSFIAMRDRTNANWRTR